MVTLKSAIAPVSSPRRSTYDAWHVSNSVLCDLLIFGIALLHFCLHSCHCSCDCLPENLTWIEWHFLHLERHDAQADAIPVANCRNVVHQCVDEVGGIIVIPESHA